MDSETSSQAVTEKEILTIIEEDLGNGLTQ